MLTSHLGLDIPPDCHITVGDKTRYWKDGQVTMFDTSIFHDAVNDSDEYRYILMLRVWHPELTDTERAALPSRLSQRMSCMSTSAAASPQAAPWNAAKL